MVSAGATQIEQEMQPGDRERGKGNCVHWYHFCYNIGRGKEGSDIY